MSLRDALQTIYDSHGYLTPQLVVDEARPKTHPLHDRFEWDNKIAGESWRRYQAHELIRTVRVVIGQSESGRWKTVRAFHAVQSEGDAAPFVYEPVEKVIADPVLTELVMRNMEREWRTLHRRYSEFEEFAEMVRRDIEGAA